MILQLHQNYLEHLLKHKFLSAPPQVSGSPVWGGATGSVFLTSYQVMMALGSRGHPPREP